MNKLLIGLLIVAAGAGAFFLLRKKKPASEITELKKELIIGKWMPEKSADTLISNFRYNFTKDGNVLRSLNDSVKADTSHYEWNRNNELVWSALTQKPVDTLANVFVVLKLNNDSLQLQRKDSSVVLFLKVK